MQQKVLNINAVTKVGSGCVNNCIPYLFSKKNKRSFFFKFFLSFF